MFIRSARPWSSIIAEVLVCVEIGATHCRPFLRERTLYKPLDSRRFAKDEAPTTTTLWFVGLGLDIGWPTQKISRYPFNKINNNWYHYHLFWWINPFKPRAPTLGRQVLHWEVKRQNFSKSWTCSHCFFMKKLVTAQCEYQIQTQCLKCPQIFTSIIVCLNVQ
jgi:hypothetical protein